MFSTKSTKQKGKLKLLTGVLSAAMAVAAIGGCGRMMGTSDSEESGARLARNETHNEVHSGVRLILSYDAGEDAFIGTMENTTSATLRQVRVEVHLYSGSGATVGELGPTPDRDLAPGAPGQSLGVRLNAEGKSFATWSAHAEVGPRSGGGEGGGEHGPDGDSGGS